MHRATRTFVVNQNKIFFFRPIKKIVCSWSNIIAVQQKSDIILFGRWHRIVNCDCIDWMCDSDEPAKRNNSIVCANCVLCKRVVWMNARWQNCDGNASSSCSATRKFVDCKHGWHLGVENFLLKKRHSAAANHDTSSFLFLGFFSTRNFHVKSTMKMMSGMVDQMPIQMNWMKLI